jgi:hypothetical protein
MENDQIFTSDREMTNVVGGSRSYVVGVEACIQPLSNLQVVHLEVVDALDLDLVGNVDAPKVDNADLEFWKFVHTLAKCGTHKNFDI